MTVTIQISLGEIVLAPREMDFVRLYYGIEIDSIPRIGEKISLNGMQETIPEEQLENDHFWIGDCHLKDSIVTDVIYRPFFKSEPIICVEVSEYDTKQIVKNFKQIKKQRSK